jgi:tRNA threonylcarbamoyladenosine biosynthesis protein TsaE
MKERLLKNLEDTNRIAQGVASAVSAPLIIGLVGDLGAGKTTFVRSLIEALGGTTEVTSPTFVLQHIYSTSKGSISHWDLYRLKSPPEELFEDISGRGITIIEWVDKFSEIYDLCDVIITLKVAEIGEESVISRVLTFSGPKEAKFEHV